MGICKGVGAEVVCVLGVSAWRNCVCVCGVNSVVSCCGDPIAQWCAVIHVN